MRPESLVGVFMDKQLPRKLAAILYADVSGYSRLTGQDEDQTHQQLSEGLNTLTSMISTHGGIKVHEAGDAILAEFSSVTAAVDAAIESQKSMALWPSEVAGDERVRFRIGVHLGEVIQDRGDIYGDGVNIAARIQEIASPGSLCVSSAVFDQLAAGGNYNFDDLGYRDFKNIEKPVHVYHLRSSELLGTQVTDVVKARVEHQPLFDDAVENMIVATGRCVCGSVGYEINQESLGSGFCHCRICQRSTGAPVTAWTAFPADSIKFTGDKPKYFRISLIADRGLCIKCGTPLVWRSLKPEPANYIIVFTTTLDNPKDYAPTWHGGVESQMPWLDIRDDLPRTRCEESPSLRKSWGSVGAANPDNWVELGYEQIVSLDGDPNLDPAED